MAQTDAMTDSFLAGQGIPVDPGQVEMELAKLWGPAAELAGGPELENPNVTRIALANLVVECLAGSCESLCGVLETVIAQFPCRAIVLRGSDEPGRRIAAEVSAKRSCESRDSFRTRRPNRTIASTTSGTPTRHKPASLGLVTIIITIAPSAMTRLRSANEAEEPTTTWISVVSAVRRDSTSPVRVVSKKLGLKERTWLKMRDRTSAVTRSPIQVTR